MKTSLQKKIIELGKTDPELFKALSMQKVELLCLAATIVLKDTDSEGVQKLATEIIAEAGGLKKAHKAVGKAIAFFHQPDDWSKYQN